MQVHEATEKPGGIWRLAKWARTKSHLPPPIPQFPTLQTENGLATTFEEKERALRMKFFPPPPEADLSDIANYSYPPQLADQNQLTIVAGFHGPLQNHMILGDSCAESRGYIRLVRGLPSYG